MDEYSTEQTERVDKNMYCEVNETDVRQEKTNKNQQKQQHQQQRSGKKNIINLHSSIWQTHRQKKMNLDGRQIS